MPNTPSATCEHLTIVTTSTIQDDSTLQKKHSGSGSCSVRQRQRRRHRLLLCHLPQLLLVAVMLPTSCLLLVRHTTAWTTRATRTSSSTGRAVVVVQPSLFQQQRRQRSDVLVPQASSRRPIPPTLDGGDEMDHINYNYSMDNRSGDESAAVRRRSKLETKIQSSRPERIGQVQQLNKDGTQDKEDSQYGYEEEDVLDDGEDIVLPSYNKPILPPPSTSSDVPLENSAFAFLEDFDNAGVDAPAPPPTVQPRSVPMAADPFALAEQQEQKALQAKAKATSPQKPWNTKYETKGLQTLQEEMKQLEADLIEQNNGVKFNMNSTQQVAKILFGPKGGSTRRSVLDGMAAGGNRMASLLTQYRDLNQRIGRIQRRRDMEDKGIAVRSASSVQHFVAGQNKTVVSEGEDPLLLVDASAYIFRAYHAMAAIHRTDGLPTGAVMGFCKMLNTLVLDRMLQGEQPRLVLCFDAKGSKTFRHELYPDYKGNRNAVPMDLKPQFDFVEQAGAAYGIIGIKADGFEADDVIATLATMAAKEGLHTNILSGDKDLMQLVSGLDASPSIHMIDPMKRSRTTYTEVVEKWNVPPDKLGDVLALAGDTADNVPGVKGIGPVTAAKLINEFGSLEEVLANADDVQRKTVREKLQQQGDNARLSRKLVELNRTVPLAQLEGLPAGLSSVSELRMDPIEHDRILKFYKMMGFAELQKILDARSKGGSAKRFSRESVMIPKPEDFADVPF